MDALLADATDSQREAITHLEGPLLVLAGPGSGKTRVVTRRIAWLIDQGVPPDSVLAITFTNKAAGEMRSRVEDLLDARGLWVSTFHAMGARMLRRNADSIGLDRSFSIYDTDAQQKVVRDILRDLDVDTTRFRPSAVLSAVSRLKTELTPPEKAAKGISDFFGEIVAKAYPRYEKRLLECNAVDFDDLLVKCLKLLQEAAPVREYYQRRFQFVLVDEYQDTNRVQFLLLRLLSDPQRNLHVTGDPDQAIYGFRGANIRNILDFEKDYPETAVVRLEENFRSTALILKGADALIRGNRQRKAKRLVGTREDGKRIRVVECLDEEDEGRRVADSIRALLDDGVSAGEISVFYRIHALSRSLERAFIQRKIPYVIVRGTEFFRRAEVLDLLAYLKILANPKDSESLLRILNVPARGIGKTTRERLLAWAAANGVPLLTAVGRVEEVDGVRGRSVAAVRNLGALLARMMQASDGDISDLLEMIVTETSYADHLKTHYPDNHEDRWDNVVQLVSSATEFETKNPGKGLLDYLEEVSLLSDVDGFEDEEARVAFMTLHTAKGLEYDHVYITGVEQGLLPHSRSAEDRADVEEERRLLFVGMTRAKERLILTHAQSRFRWGEHASSMPSVFLDEIDAESVEKDSLWHGTPTFREEVRETADRAREAPADGIRAGVQVRHDHFGIGRVTALSGSGPTARVTVDFANHGPKKLVLMYARLALLEERPW